MWLKASPGKGRSESEKAELAEKYKPGDNVVPPIRQDGEREHRRRRRRHDENGEAERDSSEEDRRQMEEAMARSLRETRLSPEDANRGNRARNRSRSRSAETRDERHSRRRREELERRRRHAHGSGTSTPDAQSSATAPSVRQANQAEARQRERHVEHQASLRSLMSASDGGLGEMEEEILRQIVDEGLLEGINLDDLNGAQEDELSERIADAYRRRHLAQPNNHRSGDGGSRPSTRDSRDRAGDRSNRSPRHSSGDRRHHSRSQSSTTQDSGAESRRPLDRQVPPLSRPRLLEATDTATPPTSTTNRRRRASDHSRRQTSPSPYTQRTNSEEVIRSQAARSATDLTSSSRPSTSDEAGRDRRPRHSSEARRAATDKGHEPSIAELWRQRQTREDRARILQSGSTESPQHLSPTSEHPPSTAPAAVAPVPRTRHGRSSSSSVPVRPLVIPLTGASSPPQQLRSVPTSIKTVIYTEPSVSCYRCKRKSIEHSLHRYCNKCDVSLCLYCYRNQRGCNHWFGFGPSAIRRWEASATRAANATMERPHTLVARKWLAPPSDAVQSPPIQKNQSQPAVNNPVLTTSDPSTRLQSGLFCDRCHTNASTCFWSCSTCNDGEWGYCNSCVDTHHICTHPLLPVAARSSHPDASSPHPPPPHLAQDYIALRVITHCEVCHVEITPRMPRYHCPFHPPAGDYNICPPCYNRLVKARKIKSEDGPNGWRRCPGGGSTSGKGHRMIIVDFEDEARRVVMQDLVGGWRLREDDPGATSSDNNATGANQTTDTSSSAQEASSFIPGGTFTWREPSRPNTPITKPSSVTLNPSSSSSLTPTPSPHSSPNLSNPSTQSAASHHPPTAQPSFPPSGGIGLTCQAIYSYFPDIEADPSAKDELSFPRGAEITEAEDVNGDWWLGFYCGDWGSWPGNYGRVVG